MTVLRLLLALSMAFPVNAENRYLSDGKLTSAGSFYIEYRAPDPIPFNEVFSLDFRILDPADKSKPVVAAVVAAQAWMPDHSHGTMLQPKIIPQGDGAARAEGFLLHMEGHWELRVSVVANGEMERAVFNIYLEP